MSISLAGLTPGPGLPWSGGARAAVEWAAGLGARAVQLDSAAAGVRARELDRSARRDLASLFRRLGVGLSGLDLWIPAAHFAEAGRVERAVEAVEGALTLAADLDTLLGPGSARGRVVSATLPKDTFGGVRERLSAAAERCGARVADHAWPPGVGPAGGLLGVGLDPAAVFLAGGDPAAEASRLGVSLASALLADVSPSGRVVPGCGVGRLDRLAYEVALATSGYDGWLVTDLRGLPDQDRAARVMLGSGGSGGR